MKTKLFYTLLVALFATCSVANAQLIVVQSGSNATVFTDLDSAIAAASPNDYLYLSGGVFNMNGIATSTSSSSHIGRHFYKPLHIIGAGIAPDSTLVTLQTIITNPWNGLAISESAAGITFDGIAFGVGYLFLQNDDNTPDSSGTYTFNRCSMSQLRMGANSTSQSPGAINVVAHETIIGGGLDNAGLGLSSATVDRCLIFGYGASGGSASVVYNNCIMQGVPGSARVNNCIIYPGVNDFANPGGAVFNNCFFGDGQPGPGSDVFNNCQFGVIMDSVFVNAPVTGFAWGNNYHLKPNSGALNYGTDGHDIGVYGTATPTKEGYVPYNPHFTGATIPASTDGSGNLNIHINVAAQPY